MNIKETKRSITQAGPWVVYRHVRHDKNIPFYIGIGKDPNRPTSRRFRNKWWNSIVAKTSYSVDILLKGLSKADAITKEIEFIKLYGRADLKLGYLCNLTDGGEGANGMVYTPERNAKISSTLTGSTLSEQTKTKCCLGQKHRIPIIAEGVEYPSLRQAAKALGIHKLTVKKRYCKL